MQLYTYTLPAPQRYVETINSNAVSFLGLNGTLLRDVRVNHPISTKRVQIGWEGLTESERDIVINAWHHLIENETTTFTDVFGSSYTARLPTNDRAFRWAAYDGSKNQYGVIQALYDIVVVLELD